MTDISTSVTFRERMTYATSRVAPLSGWGWRALAAVVAAALTYAALWRWGSDPAPNRGDALITTGVAVAILLVAPLWRFIHGVWTARTAHLVSLVEELQAQIPPTEGWVGIEHDGRYFAWDGPNFYDLNEGDPEPTPAGLTDALEATGYRTSYGLPAKLTVNAG